MTAQIHFTAIFFAEPDGTGSWQAGGPEDAPVDADQFVFDDETDEWREPTDAEREIAIGASTELAELLHADEVGDLGLSFDKVGQVAQALGRAALERENATKEQIVAYLTSDAYDEDELWTVLGPLIDKVEDAALGKTEDDE